MNFVLDQNFPIQATQLPWPYGIILIRLSDLNPRLVANTDDWEILLALNRVEGIAGCITNDDKMLSLAREMIALQRTRLKLVVTVGVGHDPVRATGLLMVGLPQIARLINGGRHQPEVFRLRPSELGKNVNTPGQLLDRIARAAKIETRQLIAQERRVMQQRGATL